MSNKRSPGTHAGRGHVYALAWPAGHLIKVGGTARLGRRLGELRGVYKPHCFYLAAWSCKDVPSAERGAHEALRDLHILGEHYTMLSHWLEDYAVVARLDLLFGVDARCTVPHTPQWKK